MTHLENALNLLKEEVKNMWELVGSQLTKARSSFLSFDKNLAREVMHIERRVNALELKIDRDCEDILALHTPVAIDLRLIIATLKINSNLERIGDFAEGIAKHVLHSEKPFDAELVKSTKVIEMYDAAIDMFNDALVAFENEDTLLARTVFGRDEFLDDINSQVNVLIAEYLKNFPSNLDQALHGLSIIRKLERVGDHTKNIAEEIIFYIDAKVIKHSNKKSLL